MAAIEQHVLKVRSPVDGREVPYHVSAPSPLPKAALPVVFLLHDAMADPSPGAFVEEAFRAAAEWKAALADGPPGLLVQPWGRGNGAWFGAGGRALFGVWEQLQDQFQVAPTAALIGAGAGGTGALQLAAHFPGQFHAVTAINPWVDERLDLPLGSPGRPAWEMEARSSVRPVDLALRLDGCSVSLALAEGDALTSLNAGRHFRAMAEALERGGVNWRDVSPGRQLIADLASPLDRASLWKGVVSPQARENADYSRPRLPQGLLWRPLSLVVGTLGETEEVEVLRGVAERLRERWLSGEDAGSLAPGDRRVLQEVPILEDSAAVADEPQGDLVIVGSPRLNLLAAKWSNRLGIGWPDVDRDEFAVLGRAFTDPLGFGVIRGPRPDGEDGRVIAVTAGSLAAWADVVRVRFWHLPDIFVQAKPGEILWMNHEEE